jgi:hypothetical protein
MELDAYASHARLLCAELEQEIEQYGVEKLHALCGSLDIGTVQAYLRENESGLLAYVRSTPSQRKRLYRDFDADSRVIFVLLALHVARCSHAYLLSICDHAIQSGPSYRDIASQAARAALELQRGWPTLWPYEDYPDPFHET